MLRPRLRIPRAPRLGLATPSPSPFLQMAPAQRSLHTLPDVPYKLSRDGSPALLTPTGYDIAWTQYQSMILNKLNQLAAGTEWESRDIKTTLLESAREPDLASVFNHASMAHNNHFFFRHISPDPVPLNDALETHLNASFGSIETLRREMLFTAMSMFGPGFVWLVKVEQTGLFAGFKVLPTYLAGSPYPGAHWRRQEVDLNTAVGSTPKGIEAARTHIENTAYGLGKKTFEAKKRLEHAPGGTNVVPVLCVNVWEHVYMPDYGIAGKQAFLEKWWKHINWNLVTEEASLHRKSLTL